MHSAKIAFVGGSFATPPEPQAPETEALVKQVRAFAVVRSLPLLMV